MCWLLYAFLLVTFWHAVESVNDPLKRDYLKDFVQSNGDKSWSRYQIPTVESSSIESLSRAEFDTILRRGVPTVFRNVAFDWDELRNLTCTDFGKRWPDTKMRAEYTNSDHEVMVRLGDSESWVNNERAPQGVHAPPDHDTEQSLNSRPSVSPYVLHIKDRVKPSMKEEISRMFPGLPWTRTDTGSSSASMSLLNAQTRDSIELWFQGTGGGTFAHNDAYCHSVFSVQLRGTKKWTFMQVPEVSNLSRDIFDEFDSGIYDSVHAWDPDFEVTLEPGDGVVFPPGYMHETRTVDGGADGCGTSATFNVPIPMPSRLVRTFLNRYSTSPEVSHCMSRWESFVTMNATLQQFEVPTESSGFPRMVAQNIFTALGKNETQKVTLFDLENYFLSNSSSVSAFHPTGPNRSDRFGDLVLMFERVNKPLTPEQLKEGLTVRAKDTLDMWDIDGDGQASFEEITKVVDFFQYHKFKAELVARAIRPGAPRDATPLAFGSELFKQRLDMVDEILREIRPNPPLHVEKRGCSESQLPMEFARAATVNEEL